ncbi:hypothetical protein [Ferruginibacter sp. HRS2-29]|uniref:hypothetical protein n=1 Tax=Ferruginibacter sp. HRS2-29 TaxID=2487334 RepID=UPI0020CC5BA2|nr:hypothetical protein [Ferruginibacter sp. HRS2-29]MCP9751720.1 hypothetical protein [Ferruginibacter sp. HRS2-29]
MKMILSIFLSTLILFGCKGKKSAGDTAGTTATDTAEVLRYFPVTNYIKGQVADIKSIGINPLKYITRGNQQDSVWIKDDGLLQEVTAFLQPVIDTANMIPFFREEKFLDQSVNAYTFTYSPIGKLPDSIQLRHWDVYIDPQEGKVRRVYMVKDLGNGRQQQLTWNASEKWCKILELSTKPDGTAFVDSEQKIIWNF